MNMKKILYKVYIALLVIFCTAVLVACVRETGTADNYLDEGPENQQVDILPSDPDPDLTVEPIQTPEIFKEWTIEELGETIVAAGVFWEDWWNFNGVFAYNSGTSVFVESEDEPAGVGMSFTALLSSTGFDSLEDVRNHLLQFYTENIVDEKMIIFREIDDIVHFSDVRAGFSRPNWDNATHVMIEQEGNRAVVETTFLMGSWHRGYEYAYPAKAIYRFTLIDGKIDVGLGPWANSEDMIFEALPFTISQLGRVIESEGRFWESWRHFAFAFDTQHILWEEQILYNGNYFAKLLPSSGFENMDGIRNRLWNYTEDWVEQLLTCENTPFVEYNEALYINVERPRIASPDWNTATHVLVEQDGQHAIVETTVGLIYSAEIAQEARLRFTFIGGQIDVSEGFPRFAE